MEKITVWIEQAENNLSAYVDELPGCTATGVTLDEIERNMREAVTGHLQVTVEFGDDISEVFKSDYELVFKFDVRSYIKYWRKTYTLAALSKITGIPERQLWTYSEKAKPHETQKKRIIEGIHKAGKELLSVELY